MFRGSTLNDCWSPADGVRQQVTAQRGFLSAVIVSILLHIAGFAMAGDAPFPIIEVKLTEFAIELPKTVPVGKMIFKVTNAGTMEHNFEVEGKGLEEKFEMNLKPGETKDLQVELPAGTYTVYCPVNDHKKRGMQLELIVAQQQSHSVSPSIILRVSP